jgi:hypothetical protein
VNAGALRAFERAEVETHTSRHDAREHRDSTAFWARWPMDAGTYVVRQEIRFLHNASFKGKAGAQHSLSPVGCLWSSPVIRSRLALRVPVRCSMLLSSQEHEGICSTRSFSDRQDFSTI